MVAKVHDVFAGFVPFGPIFVRGFGREQTGHRIEHTDQRCGPAGKGQRDIQQVGQVTVHDPQPQSRDHKGTTGVPRDQRAHQRAALFHRAAEVQGRIAHPTVQGRVHTARQRDRDIRITRNHIGRKGRPDGRALYRAKAFHAADDRQNDRLQTAGALQRAAKAQGNQHQRNGPHHRLDAARVQQAVDVGDARVDGIARLRKGEHVMQPRALPEDRHQSTGQHTGKQRRQRRLFHQRQHNHDQGRRQRDDPEAKAFLQAGCDLIDAADVACPLFDQHKADDHIDHQRDDHRRHGRGQHVLDVVEYIRARHRRREVRGVRQRRYLIAKERARHDRTGGPIGRDTETRTDPHQRQTNGADCAPAGPQRQGNHRTEDHRSCQKDRRGQQGQPVIDQRRHRARRDPDADDHADHDQHRQ